MRLFEIEFENKIILDMFGLYSDIDTIYENIIPDYKNSILDYNSVTLDILLEQVIEPLLLKINIFLNFIGSNFNLDISDIELVTTIEKYKTYLKNLEKIKNKIIEH